MSKIDFSFVGEDVLGAGRESRLISGFSIIDLSSELCQSSEETPGDSGYSDPISKICEISDWVTTQVKPYCVKKITMSAHAVTHLDAPLHVIENGATTDGVAQDLIGKCIVIDVIDDALKIAYFRSRALNIVPKKTIVVIRGKRDARIDEELRNKIIAAEPKAVVFGDCVNTTGVEDSQAYLKEGIPMIMDAVNLDKLRDDDVIFALPIKIKAVEAAPVRLFALRFTDDADGTNGDGLLL